MSLVGFSKYKWPDGCIGSAEAYFAIIRERTNMDPYLVDDAIKILHGEYLDKCRLIGADPDEQRTGLLFFTGAFLGVKIAETRLRIHLKAAQYEAEQRGQIPKTEG